MPQTNEGVLLLIGAIFFLIGLLGGGFEISAIKIPAVGKYQRIFSSVVGATLMGIAISRFVSPSLPPKPSAAPTLVETPTSSPPLIAITQTQPLMSPTSAPAPSTDTPTPTNTPVPQPPTPIPTEAQAVLFQDDFSSNVNGWTELTEEEYEAIDLKIEIVDGKYRKSATFKRGDFYNWTPLVPAFSRKDFELTVDATIVQASYLEHDEASIIISFRNSRNNSNLYLVYFSDSGYKVVVVKDNKWYLINDWIESSTFRLDIGRSNSFGVSVKGSLITLSANGQKLTSFNDDTLDEPGGIGLGIGTKSFSQTIIVEFDNLIIKEAR